MIFVNNVTYIWGLKKNMFRERDFSNPWKITEMEEGL